MYNASQAIVSIPDVDQLSTTILESLSCGTPVICSDIPAYHERVVDNMNGLFVNPKNLKQIEKALVYFIDNPKKEIMKPYSKMSVENDSWEKNVKMMLRVYDEPK